MPRLQLQTRQEGHGDYPEYIWLECLCGMRTIEKLNGYNNAGKRIVKDRLIKIWNGE